MTGDSNNGGRQRSWIKIRGGRVRRFAGYFADKCREKSTGLGERDTRSERERVGGKKDSRDGSLFYRPGVILGHKSYSVGRDSSLATPAGNDSPTSSPPLYHDVGSGFDFLPCTN